MIPLLIAFALPATAATIYLTFRPLWRHATGPEESVVNGTYRAITFRVILFVLSLYALALATLANIPGVRLIAPRAMAVLVGLLFVGVGDLLPRTRPNLLFGIRTHRTIDDRELWIRMHRTAGYLMVAFGLVVGFAGAFLSRNGIQDVVGTATLLCGMTLPVAYWIHSTPIAMTDAERRARRIDGAIWILRILLACVFVIVGFVKIPGSLHPMWVRMFARIGFGQWFRYFTALVEIIGGVLMVVPSANLVAVFLLGSAMVGAVFTHVLFLGIGFQTIIAVVLLSGIVTVAKHEWRHRRSPPPPSA